MIRYLEEIILWVRELKGIILESRALREGRNGLQYLIEQKVQLG